MKNISHAEAHHLQLATDNKENTPLKCNTLDDVKLFSLPEKLKCELGALETNGTTTKLLCQYF